MRPRLSTPPGVPLLAAEAREMLERKRAAALDYYRQLFATAFEEGDRLSFDALIEDLLDEGAHLGEERARPAAAAAMERELAEMRYLLEAAGRRVQSADTRAAERLVAAANAAAKAAAKADAARELTYHPDTGAQA